MKSPEIREIAATRLTVDPIVQRVLDQRWVNARVSKYEEGFLGVLAVSERRDGSLHVMDGQHRLALTHAVGHTEDLLRCNVYTELSTADEAAMFLHLNDKRNIGAIDKFRVRIVEGEESAVILNDLLKRAGWKLSNTPGDGKFQAAVALDKVFAEAPGTPHGGKSAVVEATLCVITTSWGYQREAARGDLFQGIGALMARDYEILDKAKLISALKQFDSGPLGLVGMARGRKALRKCTMHDAVAAECLDLVNKGRRTNVLPAWKRRGRII